MQDKAQLLELPALFKCFIKKATQEWKESTDHDLTLTQFRMLYALMVEGPAKSVELAEQLGVTPGAITGMADKMIEKSFVVRTRDDHDRRVVHVAITEEGRAHIERIHAKQNEAMSAIFTKLPDEDIEHLRRIFTLLLERTNLGNG
ncbi:DNA-binding MarR family transcriptional regulator [Paenibacillus phyllosphaerae]|uniref:DNA-binding MarR family transcriptional regulator n=1 Tax=Paenibacillus phyllosphaerae TaxID=274593 RepID=A0A7W5FPF6_9BACL|nr:MarR family transcriptional regulator [Paenibacillus phyllosphaerae]MBB3112316.1 DNA-binding MarR family transcriptional regulator [Paenibacillus phyllosphaerae]